jgi:hypothetical protein
LHVSGVPVGSEPKFDPVTVTVGAVVVPPKDTAEILGALAPKNVSSSAQVKTTSAGAVGLGSATKMASSSALPLASVPDPASISVGLLPAKVAGSARMSSRSAQHPGAVDDGQPALHPPGPSS